MSDEVSFHLRLMFLICNRNGSSYELANVVMAPAQPLIKSFSMKYGCSSMEIKLICDLSHTFAGLFFLIEVNEQEARALWTER